MATVVYDAFYRAMREFDRSDGMAKFCLSWWFPKIQEAGLPVPRTKLLRCDSASAASLYRHFDGKPVGVHGSDFLGFVEAAAREIGFPCFLRTGQTSGKHNWEKTCHVKDVADVVQHVLNLIEFSECCGMIGLPWDVWAVRELLPTKPVMLAYEGMSVCREFRVFVDGDRICCWHPYWPVKALLDGTPMSVNELTSLTAEEIAKVWNDLWNLDDADYEIVMDLARRAGAACEGRWSVDILDTARGWFVTDMAVAELSWHWQNCPLADAS